MSYNNFSTWDRLLYRPPWLQDEEEAAEWARVREDVERIRAPPASDLPFPTWFANPWAHNSVAYLDKTKYKYPGPIDEDECKKRVIENVKEQLRLVDTKTMLLSDLGNKGVVPQECKMMKLGEILPPMPKGPRGAIGKRMGGLTRIKGPGGGSVSLLTTEQLKSQIQSDDFTVVTPELLEKAISGGGSRRHRFRFNRSRKRVSRKRVSRKRVSRKRVSRKRVSRKRVSRKRVSRKRVSRKRL